MRSVKVRLMTEDDKDAWVEGMVRDLGLRCPECFAPVPDCPICGMDATEGCRHDQGETGICGPCGAAYAPADVTHEDAPRWVGWWTGNEYGVAVSGKRYYGVSEMAVIEAMMAEQPKVSGVWMQA